MLWAWLVGGVIGLSLLTLAVGASIAILRSKALKPSKKTRWLLTTWLLPLGGPLLVLHRLQAIEPEAIPRELVAASGLGWGALGDARPGTHRKAGRNVGNGSDDRD